MSNFIDYTVGLECNGHGKIGKLLKIEFSRETSGDVRLTAVSGHNLSGTGISKVVPAESFADRPTSSKIAEARWAFGRLGFELMAD